VTERATAGPQLLLDTCVYIDILQRRAPDRVKTLLATRLCNHSGVALAELTHLFGRLDPRDRRTAMVLAEITAVIADIPRHRLRPPSLNVLGEAGMLAGVAVRLMRVGTGRRQAVLNDATVYLQAVEQGQTVLTRNVLEFDWFDQLLPSNRVLFYRQAVKDKGSGQK
jgi:predicted nucleic acid-binding protein